MTIRPGQPYPLGATWDGRGVNFALFSENATQVDVCLFESAGDGIESRRVSLVEQTDMVWHTYLPDVRPGLPAFVAQPRWETLLDTFDAGREGLVFEGGSAYPLAEHLLAVFRLRRSGEDPPS